MERAPDLAFACVDMRIEKCLGAVGRELCARFFLSPGAKFGTPEELYDLWCRVYGWPGRRAYFFSHEDCRAQPTDEEAASWCREYAEYFSFQGVPTAAVWIADGSLEIDYDDLDDEGSERLRILKDSIQWRFDYKAKAHCFTVGEHFSLRTPGALRASVPFLRQGLGHLPEVAKTFGDGMPLPVHFSSEVMPEEQARALQELKRAGVPIVA